MRVILALIAISLFLPESAASTPVSAAPELSHYEFEVAFDPAARSLSGTLVVNWLNTTRQGQESLWFRLYPNAEYYGDGDTAIHAATVDGEAVESGLQDDPTVLEVALGNSILPGERVQVELAFTSIVPVTSDASFGILGGDPETGWWLADWHPIVAGWEDDTGWYLASPTKFGDPTYAESATYELTLTAPADLTVLGSGEIIEVADDGEMAVTSIVTAPGRDLTLSLMPGDVVAEARAVAGIDVAVSLPSGQAIPGLAEAILDIAHGVVPLYEEWLGDYPDAELDITTVPLAGASGVAWSGIVWIDLAGIASDGALADAEVEHLRFVVAHELAHQWLALTVGSNNNDHGFMTEGLVNTVAVLALREQYGVDVAEGYLRNQVAAGYVVMLDGGTDGIADAPVTDETDIGQRSRLIYGKAALGFEAIRQQIGEEAFLAGLAAYARDFRFGNSEPVDLRRAFEAASGTDLGDLWSFWFLENTTTTADVEMVLNGFANS